MKNLETCIVGVILLIILVSCQGVQYKIPEHENCILLSKTLFCTNSVTNEESEITLKEGKGFTCYAPRDHVVIEEFGSELMSMNVEYSHCPDRKCIRKVTASYGE